MLEALNFVKGSFSQKDMIPELQHFLIKDGRITGFNGTISLSAPINVDFDAVPRASVFIKAVNVCKEEAEISLTKSNRLKIASGEFSAFVDCLENWDTGLAEPSGKNIPLKKPIVSVMRKLKPFISIDASRPWSRGILLRKKYAYVTNNICLIQAYTENNLPVDIVIPVQAVTELIRIGEEPTSLSFDDNTMTFHYPGEKWLRTCVLDPTWPDIDSVLNDMKSNMKSYRKIPEEFFEALKKLVPFVDETRSVYMDENGVHTSTQEESGVSIELDMTLYKTRFNIDQLLLLKEITNNIDFKSYPEPCPFLGDKLRGVIIGMIHEI